MGRRALTAGTLAVLVVALVVAGLVGWRALSRPVDDSPDAGKDKTSSTACDAGVKKGDIVRSKDVTVSVFNAGSRDGLAGQTQDQLAARKFLRGEIGNAPQDLAGVRFVRVLAPSADDPAARLVALQFGKHTLVQKSDDNLGPGVDVVVGNEFVGLATAPDRVRATAAGSGC